MHANFNHLRFVLAAVLLTGLTSCGFELTTSLETQDVEAQISDDLATEKGIRAEIECPEDVEARKGGEFECKATDTEGTSAPVAVVQTNDSGSVDWNMDVMNVLAVEKKMSREVGKKVQARIDGFRDDPAEAERLVDDGGSLAFGDDATTRAVTARIIEDGLVWMSGSRWHGRDVLRISVSNWTTDGSSMAGSVSS